MGPCTETVCATVDPEKEHSQHRLEDAVHVARQMAHVYSNILTSVVGFLELSLQQIPPTSALKRYLEIAFQGAQQGVAFTQRVRHIGCKAAAPRGGTPLHGLLQGLAGKHTTLEKKVTEVFQLEDDLPPVDISGEQLHAVLTALLDNAHESLDGPGEVRVKGTVEDLVEENLGELWGTPQPGRHVRLDVRDTGRGLNADARAKLFRVPFFTNKLRHYGLGLTLVQSVLHSQHGGARFRENPEGGLTVSIFLPVANRGEETKV